MTLPSIAYISLWFPKPSETFIFREVMQLEAMGLPVTVFTLYGPLRKHLSPEMAEYSPKVQRLGAKRLFSWPRDVLHWRRRNRPAWKRLRRVLTPLKWGNLERTSENLWAFVQGFTLARRFAELGIEHIHSPWAGGPCTAARVASTLTGIPYSFAARAGDIYPPEGALQDKVADAAFVRVNNANNIKYMQEFCPQDPHRVELVYNALTLDLAGTPPELPSSGPKRILAMARFVRTKGMDVLLDACKLMQDQGRDFTLTMAGSGPWEARLRKQAKELGLADRVTWTGFVPHHEVGEVMRGHHVFTAPSVVDPTGDRDGIPNVIMEAMAHRVPVVATDVAGIAEVVRDRETGRLVAQRDAPALAQALAQILDEPDEARAMAERGQDLVSALFDRETNCRRLMDLFAEHSVQAPGQASR